MKYELFVDYTTGDSFGNCDVAGESLGVIFENADLARQAIKHLEEHYKNYLAFQDAPYASPTAKGETREDMIERLKLAPWWVGGIVWSWEFSIRLIVDNDGNAVQISLPYIGYFETLNRVYCEVYQDKDGLSFSPNSW